MHLGRALVGFVLGCALSSFAQVSESFFGMTDYVHRPGGTAWETWPSVSFSTIRSWETYTEWWKLEPAQGQYAWSNLDWLVATAEQHRVELLYTFGMTPQWASSQPGNTNCHLANVGAYGSCAPPANIQDWDNFVAAVATRYAGRIKHYEIWNEPNLAVYWTGTPAELVTLAEHAYRIIKSVDPTATVVGPATLSGYGARWMGTYLAAGGGRYADVIAFHGYQPETQVRVAEDISSYVDLYHQQMAAYGQSSKPLWDTEFSWGLQNTLPNLQAQAAYLAKYYILQSAKGVERAYWFAWDSANWGGLWSSTTGISPAGVAYAQVYDWLLGATFSNPCAEDSSATWHCMLTRSGGYQAEIVWNSTTTVAYSAPVQYTRYRDLAGNKASVSGSVSVGNSPILLESAANIPSSVSAVLSVNPASGTAPLTVTADASGSYDSTGGAVSSNIDFGDGTVAAGPVASHTYGYGGSYRVTALVRDSAGITSTASASVQVTSPAMAPFSIDARPTAVTVSAGKPAVYTVIITPHGRLQYPVGLSCRTPSPLFTCSFAPALIGISDVPVASVLTLQTVGLASTAGTVKRLTDAAILGMTLPLFGITFWSVNFGFATSRHNPWKRHAAVLLSPLLLAVAFIGCGLSVSNTGASSGLSASSYEVVVVASSANASRTVTLSLNVR